VSKTTGAIDFVPYPTESLFDRLDAMTPIGEWPND